MTARSQNSNLKFVWCKLCYWVLSAFVCLFFPEVCLASRNHKVCRTQNFHLLGLHLEYLLALPLGVLVSLHLHSCLERQDIELPRHRTSFYPLPANPGLPKPQISLPSLILIAKSLSIRIQWSWKRENLIRRPFKLIIE